MKLNSVARLKFCPYSVRGRAPGTSEAVSGAEDPIAGDEGSATNVLSAATAHHPQRNLPTNIGNYDRFDESNC